MHKDRHTPMEQNPKSKINPCIYNWHIFIKGSGILNAETIVFSMNIFLGKLGKHKIGCLSYMIHITVLIMG